MNVGLGKTVSRTTAKCACWTTFAAFRMQRPVATLKKKVAWTNNLIYEQPYESLVNYLRTHRRNAGLTQRDLARVLGSDSYGFVARQERSTVVPSLTVALSYQILFQVPVSEIFVGMAESLEFEIEMRLAEFEGQLGKQSARGPKAAATARKLEWLIERRSSGLKD